MIGKTVSHYKITRELGAGGMGVVYEAVDNKLERTVALKFLPPESTRDPEAKARFIQEAKAASALDHPNVCTIHEISEHEGRIFIAMASYDGESLKDRIDRGGLPGGDIVEITRQIAEGMSKAHQNGIVHRDLKPANIIITSDGTVKIVDFGLAVSAGATRLTRTGTSLGTLAYMSPEQVGGEEVTHATDIWALGVMIYEMMEGSAPFQGDFEAGIVYGIAHSAPEPPVLRQSGDSDEALEQGLRTISGKALEKNPADRYDQLTKMLADLNALGAGFLERSGGAFVRPAAWARRRIFLAVAGVLAVAALWFGWQELSSSDQTIPSIAVLPLQNISDDEGQDFYAKGITGELIVGLGRFEGMEVISRTSVMKYQDTDKALPLIAAELDVDLILEGTIMRIADQVKVTAQLIDAVKDKLLWADSYTRNSDDILILQSEIAGIIAREVLHEISSEQEALLATTRQVDPTVYEYYLRGKQKVEDMELMEARRYFDRAIELDPSFAPAYAGLSGALQSVGQWGWEAPETVYPLARTAALKAQELSGDLPEVHTALGSIAYLQDWDWALADQEFRKAMKAAPGGSQPLGAYCLYLLYCQRFEECFALAQRNIDLDPLNKYSHLILGYMMFYAQEWAMAEAHFKTMMERWPDYEWPPKELAWTYANSGRAAEAVPLYEEHVEGLKLDPWVIGPWVAAGRTDEVRNLLAEHKNLYQDDSMPERALGIAWGHQFLDEPDSVVAWLDRLEAISKEAVNGDLAYNMSVVYTGMGDLETAMRWLNRACDLRAPKMTGLLIDWQLDTLRSHPEFAGVVKRVGFPGF